jgi:sulfotransferase
MERKIHFLSGLPRSGSTLLSAILRQNPRFHAGMTSPVSTVFRGVENSTNHSHETSVFISEKDREHLLRSIFAAYYNNSREVVFDTSRLWCARLPLLSNLFPESKMIICVREIGWILDSFEKLYRKNNMRPSAIYNWDSGGTVYSRTSSLADASGLVGFSINAVQEAVASPEAKGRVMLVDYERLCRSPESVLGKIYEFIGEEKFKHDFKNVAYDAGEFDRALGAEGLHTVHGTVKWKQRDTILPGALFDQFNGPNFWRQ